MLKSKDLKEYFSQNPSERQMIIEDINKLSKDLCKFEVKCD